MLYVCIEWNGCLKNEMSKPLKMYSTINLIQFYFWELNMCQPDFNRTFLCDSSIKIIAKNILMIKAIY